MTDIITNIEFLRVVILTEKELAGLEALKGATSPGSWTWGGSENGYRVYDANGFMVAETPGKTPQDQANARFMAGAAGAIHILIASHRALQKEK